VTTTNNRKNSIIGGICQKYGGRVEAYNYQSSRFPPTNKFFLLLFYFYFTLHSINIKQIMTLSAIIYPIWSVLNIHNVIGTRKLWNICLTVYVKITINISGELLLLFIFFKGGGDKILYLTYCCV
jgi:hypothetical protein